MESQDGLPRREPVGDFLVRDLCEVQVREAVHGRFCFELGSRQ
jgi:hypothetical protein